MMHPEKEAGHLQRVPQLTHSGAILSDFPDVMRTETAAKALDCCPKTVQTLARTGQLKSVRVGRALRFTKLALLEFLENGGSRD